jgi:hypothetical protein
VKFPTWILVVLVLMGCIPASHEMIRQPGATGGKLSADGPVYIAVSRDGFYGDEPYPGSGLATSQVLLAAFAKRARTVDMANDYQSYKDALQFALEKKYRYLVYPTILHWERHATEWNAVPNRIEVKIQVIETTTDALINGVTVTAKSSTVSFGGEHPQDLLPKPFEEFVASLY